MMSGRGGGGGVTVAQRGEEEEEEVCVVVCSHEQGLAQEGRSREEQEGAEEEC